MRTRFAPSPTGRLHIGNIRTALLCWLYARKAGGEFLLRLDDTDSERSREEYVEAIREDLQWLGLNPDREVRQSARVLHYDAAVEKLKNAGRLYACYETETELETKRKMQLALGKPPIYDRESLRLTDKQKAQFAAEARKPHWRFRLEDGAIVWHDEIQGARHFEARNLSDPILVRENGEYTYMLPSAVDDMELGITHVLRGEDHISNTAIQIQLFEALGGAIPAFAHNALIKTKEGKLSKRKGSSTIADLRTQGIEPMALCSFLAKVGSADAIEVRHSLKELVAEFSIAKFGKSQTMYDVEDIARLNEKLVHDLPFEAVQARLPEGMDAPFWETVRGNIVSVSEAAEWWAICHSDHREESHAAVDPSASLQDDNFLAQSAMILPPEPWDSATWNIWMDAVKNTTDRKGKELFMPIRCALTGRDHGPEMKVLLPYIGRARAIRRLNA